MRSGCKGSLRCGPFSTSSGMWIDASRPSSRRGAWRTEAEPEHSRRSRCGCRVIQAGRSRCSDGAGPSEWGWPESRRRPPGSAQRRDPARARGAVVWERASDGREQELGRGCGCGRRRGGWCSTSIRGPMRSIRPRWWSPSWPMGGRVRWSHGRRWRGPRVRMPISVPSSSSSGRPRRWRRCGPASAGGTRRSARPAGGEERAAGRCRRGEAERDLLASAGAAGRFSSTERGPGGSNIGTFCYLRRDEDGLLPRSLLGLVAVVVGRAVGGSVNQIEPSVFTTTSLGLVSRLPW